MLSAKLEKPAGSPCWSDANCAASNISRYCTRSEQEQNMELMGGTFEIRPNEWSGSAVSRPAGPQDCMLRRQRTREGPSEGRSRSRSRLPITIHFSQKFTSPDHGSDRDHVFHLSVIRAIFHSVIFFHTVITMSQAPSARQYVRLCLMWRDRARD